MISINLEYVNEAEITCELCEAEGTITYPLVGYMMAPRGLWSFYVNSSFFEGISASNVSLKGKLCPDCTESSKYADD